MPNIKEKAKDIFYQSKIHPTKLTIDKKILGFWDILI
jgi:hypothetical protein